MSGLALRRPVEYDKHALMENGAGMDLQKQIHYWRNGSEEDMEVAVELLEKRRIRHALFYAHLALEKMLKAHVIGKTTDVPPRIHNLARLPELSGLSLPPDRRVFLERFDVYQMEGRYPAAKGSGKRTTAAFCSPSPAGRAWLSPREVGAGG